MRILIPIAAILSVIFLGRFFKQVSDYNHLQNSEIETSELCSIGEGRDAYYYMKYKDVKVGDFPTVEFNQFKDFYYLNPESWTLRSCRAYKDGNENLSITFSFIDWLQYKKWRNKIEMEIKAKADEMAQQALLKQQNEVTLKILESVQKDIDKIRGEANRNISEAADLIKGVKL